MKKLLNDHILLRSTFKEWDWNDNIGPILDDRLKEKILKPGKGALSSQAVCLSVSFCLSARGLQSTPFELGT